MMEFCSSCCNHEKEDQPKSGHFVSQYGSCGSLDSSGTFFVVPPKSKGWTRSQAVLGMGKIVNQIEIQATRVTRERFSRENPV